MNALYPLKFKPILKDKIWGGTRLRAELKKTDATDTCGESWEVSDVEGDVSEVANGFLQGNDLRELIEIYMGDLVGDHVYETFGDHFPLLIKFIDANDKLSIQVHPGDEMAAELHNCAGKTEMWYVVKNAPDANLIIGFNQEMDAQKYLQHLNDNQLEHILNYETATAGDVFFLPAGRIHAICEGLLIAEIQQTSDITYRIFDWNRTDANGNPRELHTDLALKAIDFTHHANYRTNYRNDVNKTNNIVDCQYFTTNIIVFNTTIEKDYNQIDSFVTYMCIEGQCTLQVIEGESVIIKTGETVLLPAVIKNIELIPTGTAKLLEVYIKQ